MQIGMSRVSHDENSLLDPRGGAACPDEDRLLLTRPRGGQILPHSAHQVVNSCTPPRQRCCATSRPLDLPPQPQDASEQLHNHFPGAAGRWRGQNYEGHVGASQRSSGDFLQPGTRSGAAASRKRDSAIQKIKVVEGVFICVRRKAARRGLPVTRLQLRFGKYRIAGGLLDF